MGIVQPWDFPTFPGLYSPLFYQEHKHWIAFKVDLITRKEVAYGMLRGRFVSISVS